MRIGRAQGRTDTGRRRLQNEDAFVCEPPLFAVADGMGGARAGELASGLAASAIEERVGALSGEAAVAELVREANARIFAHANQDPATAGMGTTVTIVLVDEAATTAYVGHVGDSRAYRIADGALEQLTADHSLVAELVRTGRLTEAEAAVHPHRSVITRALGTDADVDVDTRVVALAPGELLLLCSDGLTTMVTDQELLRLATEAELDPHRVVDVLVDAANQAGGEDNVTVVALELVEGDPPERPVRPAPPARPAVAQQSADETSVSDGVRRHGAGQGGRLPALLLVAAVLLIAALVLWWGIAR